MVFRPTAVNWLAVLSNGIRGGGKATYATSTIPKMKSYAPAADYGYVQQQQRGNGKSAKKDFVPVYVAIGMIALSTGLGVHTMWNHLRNSPGVYVKKQRRESLPEVFEPEHVAEDAQRFINKSFFRKVAHVQDRSYPDHDHIPSPYAYTPRVESLKSVGVDP
ncbi:hypothetical protein RJT34_03055 [Clitoria ternatea]|uniref:Uncharacterized protein n=1 Tax=Clitoria ternatea TaxID=43366 RepID=A0AAN9KL04_CLITE